MSIINQINLKNWYIYVILKAQDTLEAITLLDSDAHQTCIKEITIPLIPSQYYEETKNQLLNMDKNPYKLSKANICNKGYCFQNLFKHIKEKDIHGIPFITPIDLSNINQNDSQINNIELKDKNIHTILFLLIYDDSKEALYKTQTFDSSRSKSSNENVTLCPNNCNVNTKDQSQEELLFDIIERIDEREIKSQYL